MSGDRVEVKLRRKVIQTKHIPDEAMIRIVHALENTHKVYQRGGQLIFFAGGAHLWDIQKLWDALPPKVIQSKLGKLEKKGLLNGCACGCRGDFQVTEAGMALI